MDAETQERVEDAINACPTDTDGAIHIPTEEEKKALEHIEVRLNKEWLASEEGKAYTVAVDKLYTQSEVVGNQDLERMRDKLLYGEITKDEFEAGFSAIFSEILTKKYEERARKDRFNATLGLKFWEYEDVHKLNPRVHYDMDLTDHYVEIVRDPVTRKVTEAHVHQRKHWPDGTPRLTIHDFAPFEKAIWVNFIDLKEYHEDGELNVELTVARHEDYYDRKDLRREEKAGKYAPLMPRDPFGRNDRCPCGSGKKYKKCHQGTKTAIFGTDIKTAEKHFGKGFFDYKAPEGEEVPQ